MKHVSALCAIYSLATSSTREHLVVVSGCLRLPSGALALHQERRPRTPSGAAPSHSIRSIPPFGGLQIPVRSCSCPSASAVPVQTFSSGLFPVSFCAPQISTTFDHCSTAKARCRSLLKACRRSILKDTSCCDKPLSSQRRSAVSTNQPEF